LERQQHAAHLVRSVAVGVVILLNVHNESVKGLRNENVVSFVPFGPAKISRVFVCANFFKRIF
jgi:hypothetical protein